MRPSHSLQGTIPFLALWRHSEFIPHRPHHDLESFYWVWVWCLLRHAPQQFRLLGRAIESADERVAVFESAFGAKKDLKDIFYSKESFLRKVPVVSGELVSLTLALLKINRDIHRARYAMNDAFQAVDDRPTSDEFVQAKAKAISLALKHRTFLNILNECLSQSGWPDDDAAMPFHFVSRQSQSSSLMSDGNSDAQSSMHRTDGARRRPRDSSEDPLCIPSPKRFRFL